MFQFKQFTIHQQHCAMKVGTDGVLLGAWTNIEHANHILDIGTGTGLIALMLAQRTPDALIDAIEIEKKAYQQACENISNSPWSNRVNAFHEAIQHFSPVQEYDLIVSNPPFFSNSLKNPDASRKTARHTDSLTSSELVKNAKRLLKTTGKLSIIYPVTDAGILIRSANDNGFHCTRITKVIPKTDAIAKRLLLEFSLSYFPCQTDELYIEKDKRHVYSEQYKALTKDFYLNF